MKTRIYDAGPGCEVPENARKHDCRGFRYLEV